MVAQNDCQAIISLNVGRQAFEYVHKKNVGFFKKYRVFSKHNLDIFILILIYLSLFTAAGITAFVLGGLFDKSAKLTEESFHPSSATLPIIFGAAIFGGLVTIVSKLIEGAQKRLGTIDLFVSEIISIGRIFTSGNLIGGLIYTYLELDQQNTIGPVDDGSKNGPPVRFSAEIRKENYLSIFEKNNMDLGPLSAKLVSNVTAFYTFLKASRDATGKMSLWNASNYPAHEKKLDVISIVYFCLLIAIHGRESIIEMVEDEEERDYAVRVFETIELQSFLFLSCVIQNWDPRQDPLKQRFPRYKHLVYVKYKDCVGDEVLTLFGNIEKYYEDLDKFAEHYPEAHRRPQ